jgi:hypothetical protein
MSLGRLVLTLGLVLVVLGVGIMIAQKLGVGRLPGDLVWKGKGFTVYLPIVSSIVLSLLVTLLLNLFRK